VGLDEREEIGVMTEQETDTRLVESLDGTLVARVPADAVCQYRPLVCSEPATHVIPFPAGGENAVLAVCTADAELYERLSAPRT
jgi:hypothetical protein